MKDESASTDTSASAPEVAAPEANVDRRTPGRRRRPRNPLLLWGSIGAAVVLLVAVGIPVSMWAGERATVSGYAIDDAEALTAAVATAREASDGFDAAATIATAHLESTAIPVRDVVVANITEFGQEHTDVLAVHIASLQKTLDMTSPAVDVATEDGSAELTNAGDGEQLEASLDGEPAADPAEQWAYRVTALQERPEEPAEALREYYLSLQGTERMRARADVAEETQRFQALAASFDEAALGVWQALDAVEESIVGVLVAGSEVGPTTAEALQYSAEEQIAALNDAAAALEAAAGVELPMPWEARTFEQPSGFTGILETVEGYVSAASAARASHAENTPPPPPPPSTGGGGGGGGGGLYMCYRYSAWGGSYLGWCRR